MAESTGSTGKHKCYGEFDYRRGYFVCDDMYDPMCPQYQAPAVAQRGDIDALRERMQTALDVAGLQPLTEKSVTDKLLGSPADMDDIAHIRQLSREISTEMYRLRLQKPLPASLSPPRFIALCGETTVCGADGSIFFPDRASAVFAASQFAASDPLGRFCVLQVDATGTIQG